MKIARGLGSEQEYIAAKPCICLSQCTFSDFIATKVVEHFRFEQIYPVFDFGDLSGLFRNAFDYIYEARKPKRDTK